MNTKSTPRGRLLSFSAAARRVDKSWITLRKWVEQGAFPAPRVINGRGYYDAAQIDTWLAQVSDHDSRPAA
jgi:hypothetical protein